MRCVLIKYFVQCFDLLCSDTVVEGRFFYVNKSFINNFIGEKIDISFFQSFPIFNLHTFEMTFSHS